MGETPTRATPWSTYIRPTDGAAAAGGAEKFEAAGFGHEATGELAGAAGGAEMDAGGGPLANTDELDDGGELSAAGSGLDGAGSDPDFEAGPMPLPHATSAAVTATMLTARRPTVAHLPPSSPDVGDPRTPKGGRRLSVHHFARCRIHQKQNPAMATAAARKIAVSNHWKPQ